MGKPKLYYTEDTEWVNGYYNAFIEAVNDCIFNIIRDHQTQFRSFSSISEKYNYVKNWLENKYDEENNNLFRLGGLSYELDIENNNFFISESVFLNLFETSANECNKDIFISLLTMRKLSFFKIDSHELIEIEDSQEFREIISKEKSYLIVNVVEFVLYEYMLGIKGEMDNIFLTEQGKTDNFELQDFSNTRASEKVLFLYKAGVIKYLKTIEPFKSSTNALATYISAITGEKSITIQSYINPIDNENVNQKNNPLLRDKIVKKVNNRLIEIGLNPLK